MEKDAAAGHQRDPYQEAEGVQPHARNLDRWRRQVRYHCSGGVGTDSFDKMAAIEEWVAKGAAPDHIVAAHRTAGTVDRTRPLCPYGKVATYNGNGSTDDAANFTCKAQ